ncbi:MAG: hypothetical protein RMY36_030905 [Nostoc sp. SerVER01]|nr:hypothetical protein [Nostoc sp. SerVER01]
MYTAGCNRVIARIESKIEKFKKDFYRSPQYIVITKDYYECFIWYQLYKDPGSNAYTDQFQGIPLVLIPGHEILELTGSPKDMMIYQMDFMKKNQQ